MFYVKTQNIWQIPSDHLLDGEKMEKNFPMIFSLEFDVSLMQNKVLKSWRCLKKYESGSINNPVIVQLILSRCCDTSCNMQNEIEFFKKKMKSLWFRPFFLYEQQAILNILIHQCAVIALHLFAAACFTISSLKNYTYI